MAYLITIDGFEVKESDIDGVSSLTITKGISERYNGYWNADGFGFSDGGSNDRLTLNGDLVQYVKQVFETSGFEAEIVVTISNGSQKSTLLIDFSQYAEDCCSVSFTLRPFGGGDLIKSRDEIEYPLQLTEEIEVPVRELPKIVNFTIANESFVADVGTSITHSIPLKVAEDNYSDGTSSNVSTNTSIAFFESNKIQCIELNGTVKVNVLSNTASTFQVYLNDGNDILVGSFPINSTLTEQTITINSILNVTENQEIRLTIKGGNGFAQFIYDSASAGLSLQKCKTDEIVWKKVKAISLRNAFKSVISQMTAGKAQLGSYYFDNCFFDSYLTSNDGLVNEIGRINVSFFKLYDELNNKFPSSINVRNGTVDILSRCSFYTCDNPYQITLDDAEKEINESLVYSSIKVGYNNWASDGSFKSLEYNGKREFQSNYALSSKSLSLLNDWSASSSIISEQILKKKEKEEIHWIIVNKTTFRAETNEYINASVFDNDRAINLRITPTRNLERHSKFLLNNLSFVSGEGNYGFSSSDIYDCDCFDGMSISETQDINNKSIFGKFIYKGTIDACDVQLEQLEGCVLFEYCNKTVFGFLSSVSYKTSDYSGEIYVEILELNL